MKKDKEEKPKMYIASCSFGKDSIATILLALEHNEPLDRVVFSEVMFDHEKGISGEIPEHIEWVYKVAIPKLQSMGVIVDIVRSKLDYVYYFNTKVGKGGKYAGLRYGFPITGKCIINDRCKIKPVREYNKKFKDFNIVSYVGIAIDEPNRLKRLEGTNKVSLLAKYGYTEEMAMAKCEEYNLVSPCYSSSNRGGCWFCPNAKIKELVYLRKTHRHLWDELVLLSKTPNLCSNKFKYNKTFQDIEKEMDAYELNEKLQLKMDL